MGPARVFPGLTSWTDDHRALSELHSGGYTWKDLRRTVSTRLAARGFSVRAQHYIKHAYVDEVQYALETWDRDLADIVAGRDVAWTSVLPFRQ